MPIDRSYFNALVDDDGSNTVGSVWNKNAIKNVLLDPIDALALAALVWNAYTPSWVAATPPMLGDGTLVATAALSGGVTYFEMQLTMGTTTTYGVGAWNFGLPPGVPVILSGAYRGFLLLAGRAYDASAGASVSIAGAVPLAAAGSAGTFELYGSAGAIAASVPFLWTVGDILQLSGMYRSA
jgi:hypothetical protein